MSCPQNLRASNFFLTFFSLSLQNFAVAVLPCNKYLNCIYSVEKKLVYAFQLFFLIQDSYIFERRFPRSRKKTVPSLHRCTWLCVFINLLNNREQKVLRLCLIVECKKKLAIFWRISKNFQKTFKNLDLVLNILKKLSTESMLTSKFWSQGIKFNLKSIPSYGFDSIPGLRVTIDSKSWIQVLKFSFEVKFQNSKSNSTSKRGIGSNFWSQSWLQILASSIEMEESNFMPQNLKSKTDLERTKFRILKSVRTSKFSVKVDSKSRSQYWPQTQEARTNQHWLQDSESRSPRMFTNHYTPFNK